MNSASPEAKGRKKFYLPVHILSPPLRFPFLIFGAAFSGFFKQFPLNRLLFPVEDSGGFLKIFPFFKFPDDAFFFHHPFKPFDGFFQHLVVVNDNMRQKISPPFPSGSE
jgi:hypothetical protein